MKTKILLATVLFVPGLAFAQTSTTTGATTTSATSTQITCVTNALTKRENSLIQAHDLFNTEIKQALQTRLAGLVSAWSMTDKNQKKIKRMETLNQFKNSTNSAHTKARTSKINAWNQFHTDMKVCGVKNHQEFPAGFKFGNTFF